jgi:hypothetical protein
MAPALEFYEAPMCIAFSTIEQWYSTGGTQRHLRGYVKFKISIYILFPE